MTSHLPLAGSTLRTALASTALVPALVAALAACGTADQDTAGPADSPGASQGTTDAAGAGRDEPERITPGGVAAVVLDHLGPRAVRRFGTFEPEPGSVSVMVVLREAGPADHFAVTVSSPSQAGQLGPAGECPEEGGGADPAMRCRTLEGGTTVMTSEVAEGFSDDNAHGMVVHGSAVTPDAGAAMALYESYDRTPAVTAADLDGLLSDARLRWLTEPALNEAGEDVEVRALDG